MPTESELAQLIARTVAETLRNAPPTSPPVAYTIQQAARAVGLPANTLRDRVASGELPAVKRCRRWLIRREDLLAWLANKP